MDSPQSRLQRLVLKNYAQFIMDVLPTRTPQTVEQMLPVALKFFAEVRFINTVVLTGRRCVIIRRMFLFGGRLCLEQGN